MLLNYEKEGNPAICHKMDEPWGLYEKWNISGKKQTNTAWLHFYLESNNIKLIETEGRMVIVRV